MKIIAVDTVHTVHRLLELLSLSPFTLGFPANARPNFWTAFRSHRKAHVFGKFHGGIVGRQVKKL